MNPAMKRFTKKYRGVADAISRADIAQVDREQLAAAIADAFAATKDPDFKHDTFSLIASDPLVPCAGYDDGGVHVACPDSVEIRIGMHDSNQPDGRNVAWRERLPEGIRCVPCGAKQFSPGYLESTRT